jgi:phage tail tape-measure protein
MKTKTVKSSNTNSSNRGGDFIKSGGRTILEYSMDSIGGDILDMARGNIDTKEFVKNRGKDILRREGAELVKKVLRAGAEKAGKESLKKFAGSNPAGAVAFGVVDQIFDTAKLLTGDIDGKEYKKKTKKNVASTGGAIAGAETGAAIGSMIFPGVGTLIGGFIGGMLGSSVASSMVED